MTKPPRFVPTLTEVVQTPPKTISLLDLNIDSEQEPLAPTALPKSLAHDKAIGQAADEKSTATVPLQSTLQVQQAAKQEQLVQQVLQLLGPSLDQLLREAVDQVLTLHLQALGPDLRLAIEQAVRQSVVKALHQSPGSTQISH